MYVMSTHKNCCSYVVSMHTIWFHVHLSCMILEILILSGTLVDLKILLKIELFLKKKKKKKKQ